MSDVQVRIFLAGGHSDGWACSADHPSLQRLMDAMGDNAVGQGGSPLLRLVVPGEYGAERGLVVLRSSLIAVETTPPLVDLMPTLHASRRRAWLAAVGEGGQVTVERPPVALVPDFLPGELRDELFAWMVAQRERFRPSGVVVSGASDDDDDYRKSQVIFDLGPFQDAFLARLRSAMPGLLEELGEPAPTHPHYEIQATAHHHLDYFKVHRDNVSDGLQARRVSLVWYAHKRPRVFDGGELLLFDTVIDGARRRQGEGFRTIDPADNVLVAFPSGAWHQVRAVRCPDAAWGDGRFTVNGWLRAADSPASGARS